MKGILADVHMIGDVERMVDAMQREPWAVFWEHLQLSLLPSLTKNLECERMPTYEYRCEACGHRFEELQSFSDAHLKKCPKCKKKKLERLLGAGAAIIFKGSGFYQTDYRSESYKSAAKADEPKPAASDKSDTGGAAKSTDTKDTSATPKAEGGKTSGKRAKS